MRTNKYGLTLEAWRHNAGEDVSKVVTDETLDAWRAGEDPSDHRRDNALAKNAPPILTNDDLLSRVQSVH